MGVRLVRYKMFGSPNGESYNDHNELINRDMMNQHPIYAITGLQEVLNIIEDNIRATNIRINNVLQQIDDIYDQLQEIRDIIANLNVINGVLDTYTVDMTYNETTKILSSDVKIYPVPEEDAETVNPNAIQVLADGLYVPSVMTRDTDTIAWEEIILGETLAEIYQSGIVFSHSNGSWNNISSADEANAWYWDEGLQSFVQPRNTGTFTGFVTKKTYDYYTHYCNLRSTDGDDDYNGLVIGFVYDEQGRPHTLSAIVERQDGVAYSWRLVYDFMLPDQQVLFSAGNGPGGTTPGNYAQSGWNTIPNGITLRVTKHRNLVTAACSNWNTKNINENTMITIDLDAYSWGHLFNGRVHYGYCNFSQAYSFFQEINFISDNTTVGRLLQAVVKISERPDNEIIVYSDGIYAPKFVVSPDAGNAIEKRTNGYYVAGISKQPDNRITKLDDGLYVGSTDNTREVTQANHGFTVGDFIYYHPYNGYKLAAAIDDYDSNIVGMVTKVINANMFQYMWAGFYATNLFNYDHGFTQGMPVYISDVNPGKVVQEQPDISKCVGYPVENIGIIITIERGIQYNQEASIGDFKVSANTYNIRSDGFIRVDAAVEYKQALIQKLLDSLDATFKSSYMTLNNSAGTMKFKNVDVLYAMQKVPTGLNLFIKAF